MSCKLIERGVLTPGEGGFDFMLSGASFEGAFDDGIQAWLDREGLPAAFEAHGVRYRGQRVLVTNSHFQYVGDESR